MERPGPAPFTRTSGEVRPLKSHSQPKLTRPSASTRMSSVASALPPAAAGSVRLRGLLRSRRPTMRPSTSTWVVRPNHRPWGHCVQCWVLTGSRGWLPHAIRLLQKHFSQKLHPLLVESISRTRTHPAGRQTLNRCQRTFA